jgi:hypothetical protein
MSERVRQRLPNRRASETFGFERAWLKYAVTVSWFAVICKALLRDSCSLPSTPLGMAHDPLRKNGSA